MNLHEFCQSLEIQDNFARILDGDKEAQEFLAIKMSSLQIQYREISNTLQTLNFQILEKDWETLQEDFRQELIVKLLSNKLYFEPNRGNLKTFLLTIFARSVLDHYRKGGKKTCIVSIDAAEMLFPTWDNQNEAPSLRLKQFCYKEIQSLRCLPRTILKLWRPYFFNYSLEPDEKNLVDSCQKISIDELINQLKISILTVLKQEKSNCTISPEKIANWLNMSRDAVDQHLSTLRRKFSWLKKENLYEFLATENF